MQVRGETCMSRTWLQVAVFLCFFMVTKQSLSQFECYLVRDRVKEQDKSSGLKISSPFNYATNLNCSRISHNIYNAAMTVEINSFESIQLKVLQNLSKTVTFVWFLKKNNMSYIVKGSENSSDLCLELVRATGKQAGRYELFIQSESSNYSIYFEVQIRSRPRKPFFTLDLEYLNCFSEGYPKPVLYWMSCTPHDGSCKNKTNFIPYPELNIYGNTQVGSKMKSTSLLEGNIYCCAVNALGKECSQLYTIDMMSNTSDGEILLKSGEPFVIRCVAWYKTYRYKIKWDVESEKQMLFFNLSAYTAIGGMKRLLFGSSIARNSRNITCSTTVHPNKSASLNVIDNGFIDMNTSSIEHEIYPKQDFCLIAEFKAHPSVTCAWIHNSNVFPCSLITDENGQSISEFCHHRNTPGEYVFYVENGDVQLSKTFTLNLPQTKRRDDFKRLKMTTPSYSATPARPFPPGHRARPLSPADRADIIILTNSDRCTLLKTCSTELQRRRERIRQRQFRRYWAQPINIFRNNRGHVGQPYLELRRTTLRCFPTLQGCPWRPLNVCRRSCPMYYNIKTPT